MLITGFYNIGLKQFLKLISQRNYIQTENMIFQPQVEATQIQCIQTCHFNKLFRYLATLHYESRREILAKAEFCNKNLKDIGYCLAKKLNLNHEKYDKVYICTFGIYIALVSIRYFASLKSLLQQSFYQNIAPIFKDSAKLMFTNINNPKGEQINKFLLAFMKSIYDLGNESTTLHRKIYNKRFVDILCQFQPPNDQTTISMYCLLLIQANQKNIPYNKKLLKNIFFALKNTKFNIKNLSKCYSIIINEIPDIIPKFQYNDIIIKNLKNKISQKLYKNNFWFLAHVVEIVDKICEVLTMQAFFWDELLVYCEFCKDSVTPDYRIKFLKIIARGILQYEQKHNINNTEKLLNFVNSEPGLQVLLLTFPKISSVSLLQLLQYNIISTLINFLINSKYSLKTRSYCIKLLFLVALRVKQINCVLYKQLQQNLSEVKTVIQGVLNIQYQQFFNKYIKESKDIKIFMLE